MAKKRAVRRKSPGKKAGLRSGSRPARRAARGKTRSAPKHAGQRADFGASADAYFQRISPAPLNAAAGKLRGVIRAAVPEATESLKWGMPMYEHNGLLCYIRAGSGYLRFGFCREGVELSDPEGKLEIGGEKSSHVKLRSESDVRPELFTRWIQEAIPLPPA